MLHYFRQLFFTIVWTCLVATGFDIGIIVGQTAVETDSVVATISSGGMRRYERGTWSILSLSASNSQQAEATGTLSVFLDRDSRTQFTRRYWIPAHSTRDTWLPIRTPDDVSGKDAILTASVLNVVGSGDAATLHRTRSENRLIGETYLALDPTGINIGMVTEQPVLGESIETSTRPDEVYETVVEVRMMQDGKRTISNFHDPFLAPYPEAYEALDQLVISNDRVVSDSGGVAALRTWIARGGRAWIMVDLVEIETVRSLLGNATPYEVIDRVQLTEFEIDGLAREQDNAASTETWTAEEPVDLVRVALDSGDVYSSIDSWPASFSVPFGQGRVFFTTLGARGWRYPNDEFSSPVNPKRPKKGPTRALRRFGGIFNKQFSSAAILSEEVKPILLEQLGYRIPSRSIAALLLGLSCIVITVSGLWLARRQKLERFTWVVPLATIVPAIGLIVVGSSNTSSVPATSSVVRLASVSADTNEIHADTMAAFYSPETVELPLDVDLSGVVTPDLQDLAGIAKRAVWDDDGHGQWEQVPVATGSVRFLRAKESHVLVRPIRAHATFGSRGLAGKIVGVDQLGTPVDSIVAAPAAPHSAVTMKTEGTFEVGADAILSKREFITQTVLSSGQQQRQSVYREVFSAREKSVYPQRTTLFVWGNSASFGLANPDAFQQSGATLFAIPVDVARTPPGQPFLVPATFVRVSNFDRESGQSLVFDSATGSWLENAVSESKSVLKFSMPREVLPGRISNAKLSLKIHAPSRTVEVTGFKNGLPVVIETQKSPSGVFNISVDEPDLLQLTEDGALLFGINVSQTDKQIAASGQRNGAGNQLRDSGALGSRESSPETNRRESIVNSPWQVDYFRVQASGESQ